MMGMILWYIVRRMQGVPSVHFLTMHVQSEGTLERGFQIDITQYCKRNKEELHRQYVVLGIKCMLLLMYPYCLLNRLEEERQKTSVSVTESSSTCGAPTVENMRARAATMVDGVLSESDLQEVPL